MMVMPLQIAERQLTQKAILVTSPPAKSVAMRPRIWKVGAPGGCPMSIFEVVAMYSPQSHHETVGSAVMI